MVMQSARLLGVLFLAVASAAGLVPAFAQGSLDEKIRVEAAPGEFSIGRPDAPLTLVEFTDYQCPYCRRFHMTSFEELRKKYIDTGKLRYVTRDFPLDFHEHAMRAAMTARCAAEQGRFWEMRHVMIVNANRLRPSDIAGYAADLKLDNTRLDACVASGKYRPDIERDIAEGAFAGVSGTPSFVLGRTEKDAVVGAKIVGAQPYATFEARINALLKGLPPA